jgi:hypothetical protein
VSISLLPSNSGLFEVALEAAIDVVDIIGPAVKDLRGFKTHRPLNPTIAPWIVLELGLGQVSAYFGGDIQHSTALTTLDSTTLTDLGVDQIVVIGPTTIEDLIDQGRAWQRIRGTPAAIQTALAWIGYDDAVVMDQVRGRKRWHLYQIEMGKLPLPDEAKLLADAEYLADLSDRARSFFWRGFYGYDVRGVTWGVSKWGRAIWGDSSGVRIGSGQTKWSHGRQHSGEILASNNDQISLDVVYDDGDILRWSQDLTWDTPGLTWNGVVDSRSLKTWLMLRKPAYVGFYDVLGNVIGYAPVLVGAKDVGQDETEDNLIRYDVRVDFGVGYGSTAATASIVFGGQPAAGVKPGKRWLSPTDAVFPNGITKVGSLQMPITFQQTIKEFVTIDLRLPPINTVSAGAALLSDEAGVTLTTVDGDVELEVPDAGAVPQGGAILTDLRGSAISTGPLETFDVIYGPSA